MASESNISPEQKAEIRQRIKKIMHGYYNPRLWSKMMFWQSIPSWSVRAETREEIPLPTEEAVFQYAMYCDLEIDPSLIWMGRHIGDKGYAGSICIPTAWIGEEMNEYVYDKTGRNYGGGSYVSKEEALEKLRKKAFNYSDPKNYRPIDKLAYEQGVRTKADIYHPRVLDYALYNGLPPRLDVFYDSLKAEYHAGTLKTAAFHELNRKMIDAGLFELDYKELKEIQLEVIEESEKTGDWMPKSFWEGNLKEQYLNATAYEPHEDLLRMPSMAAKAALLPEHLAAYKAGGMDNLDVWREEKEILDAIDAALKEQLGEDYANNKDHAFLSPEKLSAELIDAVKAEFAKDATLQIPKKRIPKIIDRFTSTLESDLPDQTKYYQCHQTLLDNLQLYQAKEENGAIKNVSIKALPRTAIDNFLMVRILEDQEKRFTAGETEHSTIMEAILAAKPIFDTLEIEYGEDFFNNFKAAMDKDQAQKTEESAAKPAPEKEEDTVPPSPADSNEKDSTPDSEKPSKAEETVKGSQPKKAEPEAEPPSTSAEPATENKKRFTNAQIGMGIIGLGAGALAIAGGEKDTPEKREKAAAEKTEFKPKKRLFLRIVAFVASLLALEVVVRGDKAILGPFTRKALNGGKPLGNGLLK
jgi:hypothetical protein